MYKIIITHMYLCTQNNESFFINFITARPLIEVLTQVLRKLMSLYLSEEMKKAVMLSLPLQLLKKLAADTTSYGWLFKLS